MRGPVAVALLAALGLTACPQTSVQTEKPVTVCTKLGTSCVYAEGKLGLCVEKSLPAGATCSGNDCFVCQSQH